MFPSYTPENIGKPLEFLCLQEVYKASIGLKCVLYIIMHGR